MTTIDQKTPELVPAKSASRVARLRNRLIQARESKLGTKAEDGLRMIAGIAAEKLSRRETLEGIQTALAGLGQFAAATTFKFDPDAKNLFDFAEWAETQHGRGFVVAATLVFAQNMVQFVVSVHPKDLMEVQSIRAMQDEVRRWAECLGTGLEGASVDLSDVPTEFHQIFDARRAPKITGEVSKSTAIRVLGSQADADSVAFVIVTVPRFLQTYLMRSMVDALPDLMAHIKAK
jgi:hypothetical protein